MQQTPQMHLNTFPTCFERHLGRKHGLGVAYLRLTDLIQQHFGALELY